jgi:hypothetical protein
LKSKKKKELNMLVKCLSNSKKMWGNGSGNADILEIGRVYEVIDVEVHSWHTLFTLNEVLGKFNSCLFEEATENI